MLGVDVYQGDPAILSNLFPCSLESRLEVFRVLYRTLGPGAEGACHAHEIHVWIFDVNADGLILFRPGTHLSHGALMPQVIAVGPVVLHDDEPYQGK